MDTARYVLAVLMVILTPPAVAYWFVIHPFVGFWRRLGTKPSLVILWTGFIAEILREGIFGRVRDPRYAVFLIGCAGIALIANYTGIYVMAVLLFPALHLVAILEEREMPRLVPRFRLG